MARILVLGAGFAGLWAAVAAARKLEEIGSLAGEVEILVVDRNPYHNIRVRNYEIDLTNLQAGKRQIVIESMFDDGSIKYEKRPAEIAPKK